MVTQPWFGVWTSVSPGLNLSVGRGLEKRCLKPRQNAGGQIIWRKANWQENTDLPIDWSVQIGVPAEKKKGFIFSLFDENHPIMGDEIQIK